ncbi:proline-rich domain-containing protein [Deferrisoma camini]|uniref:proline-rich domain-containing protein n=1 Tax=Deferrisoma camini TaxID=1035120 RepID=UPI00046CA649|nr:proline-rich domain-containing protein [Deferrisoma camini]
MVRRVLRFGSLAGIAFLLAKAPGGVRAAELEIAVEGVGASTASPVVVVEHVELRFPNGTGRQTVAKDEPGFYAEALFRYQGNGTLRIQWIVDGRILVETVETLTFGTDLVTRSDKTGVALPTFEPGPHTVTLTFDNGSGQPSALAVPEITYFVAERVPPSRRPGIRLTAPAEGQRLAPRLLSFAWRPVDAPPGFFDRFRVEMNREAPVSPKGASGKGRAEGKTGPVLAAEVRKPWWIPDLGRVVALGAGGYRWRVIGFPADGSPPVRSEEGSFRLARPPPPGGVFFRSVEVAPASVEERTGEVQPPLERLLQSLNRLERAEVEAGRRVTLRVRVENSSFQERQALQIEVHEVASGLVSVTGLPPLPACGSPVASGAGNPWVEQSGYLTLVESPQAFQEGVDRARARLECRGSFAELPVAWDVPLTREQGELVFRLKEGAVVLDTARLVWRAVPAQGAGAFDFSEYVPVARKPVEGRFPGGLPSYLDMAGFRIEVTEYDASSSTRWGLYGRGVVRWRGDGNRTPVEVAFEGVRGDPSGEPLAWRATRGLAELAGDPVTLQLFGHTVRIQALRLEPERARADVAVVITATTPWSPRAPVWVGARDVPVLNGGEFVAEAAVPPGTVLPGNVPPPGVESTYLPVDVFAGGSRLLMDFSPHLGYGAAADDPEWTGLALVSALVRVPVRALDDVSFTSFDEALLGVFDTREPAWLYGRAPFLRISPAGSVSAEGVEVVRASEVPPDVLKGDPRGEMEPLSPSGFRIGFSGGTFDLVDGGVGGLDLAGWIRLPQDLGGGTLAFRHLRRGDPEGTTLRGFHTEVMTRDLPAVTIDGFTYRPDRARLVLAGGAATTRTAVAESQNPSLFTWPTDEEAFREQTELLRDAYARGPGLHLEGGSFVGAGAWSRKVGAFDGRVENLLLRVEESALVENRARGVIRVPPPAGLTLAFEGSVAADGSILVPEDGLLAPPAEGGWPLAYWRVTLYPGRYYVPPQGPLPRPGGTKGVPGPFPSPAREGGKGPVLSTPRPGHWVETGDLEVEVPRDPLGNPTGPPGRRPGSGARPGSGGRTDRTGGDEAVDPDVARPLGNIVDADEDVGQGAGSGGWGTGPSGWARDPGGGGQAIGQGARLAPPPGDWARRGGASGTAGYGVDMAGPGDRPGERGTAGYGVDMAGPTADAEPAPPRGPGYQAEMKDAAVTEAERGGSVSPMDYVPMEGQPWRWGVLSDGAFVIDGPLEEGGLRGFWLYMDRPDPARTADYGPARGVVFDTDRIEIRDAGITFDVPPELGGPEFGVASPRAEVLGAATGAGGSRWQIPPGGASGTGDFKITLDIFPDGNIGYDGDPRASPRVEPVGSVGFLGIPFTPSGEIRFARYAPTAAARAGGSQPQTEAAPSSALGLRTDREARAAVAAAVPLVTFEGTLHFPFFGSRRVRIQHTASGARVPFLSGPEQSCADLLKENGVDEIPWGFPELQQAADDLVKRIGERPEDASRNTICGDSRGYVVGRVNLRYVNAFGRDAVAESIASTASGVWFPDEEGESVQAEEFKGFLGQGEFSVLGVLKLVGVADVVRTDDGTLVERVSLGAGVHTFRALLAGMNIGRTGAKLGTASAEALLDMPEEAESFGRFVGDTVAFSTTLALALTADVCAEAGAAATGATGGAAAGLAAACAPLMEEFNRMLVTDGANLLVSAAEVIEILLAKLAEEAGLDIEIELPDDAEKWKEFGPDMIKDLVRDVGNLVNLEKIPPEELALAVVRTLDNLLTGILLSLDDESDPARTVTLGVHLPVLPARKFLEQGGLDAEDVWRTLREAAEFARSLAEMEPVKSEQPLLPLMVRLAELMLDVIEDLRNPRPGAPPQVDLNQVLEVIASIPDAACALADQNPDAADAIVTAISQTTGVGERDIRNGLALSRRVLGWVEHPALSGDSPDAGRVVRELVIPLVDDLRRANADRPEFCVARPGYDPYDAQVIAVLNVLAQVLRVAEVEAIEDPADRARQRFFWVVETQRTIARAVNTVAEAAGRDPPIPGLAFTLFDALERAWEVVTAESEDPASVKLLRAADKAVYEVGQDPDLSQLDYTPQTVELVRAVLAEAILLARAAEASEPPEPGPVLRGAARIAGAAAQMPLDRDVRLGLTLLARTMELAAEMNVWQGPAPPDGRRVLRFAEEALETLEDMARDENARRAVRVALYVARRMGTALLLADPSDPDAVLAAARGLLQDLAPLLGEAGTAAGLVEGSVVAVSRIATDPYLAGFALQAGPAVDVLERALGDEGLPEPAREHLEAAVRYLERVLDDPKAPYELRDEQGNVKAARRLAEDGTIYTYNASTRRYRIERPDGRVEEYENVDPEAFERYTAPGADPDRPEPEKLFRVEIPVDLEDVTGVLTWDKLTGLVRWEYVLAPLAAPGILVWKAGEAAWDAATGFWDYLKKRLGREPDRPNEPPRPDPGQEVVEAEEPKPPGPPGADLQGWTVRYERGFVWLHGPRGQWIRREPKDPLRDPDTGAIDITGALSGARVRVPFRGETVWLAYEGTGYVKVKGDGWTRIYEAGDPVEVQPDGDLARAEWTPGDLVFDLETDAGGYALAAHRDAGVSVRLYPGRFEVRPAEFLGRGIVSDPTPELTWYPQDGRWEGGQAREQEQGRWLLEAGDGQILVQGVRRSARVGAAEVLAVQQDSPPKGRMLQVRWKGGEYRFEAWRPDPDSDRWDVRVRAYGFEERAGPLLLPPGPAPQISRAGEPEPEFQTRREADGTVEEITPTGTVRRTPSGRTRVQVQHPDTGQRLDVEYDEQKPVYDPPPPAPEPVADGDPAQATEADTMRRAQELRRQIREALTPQDFGDVIEKRVMPFVGDLVEQEVAEGKKLTERQKWEIKRTLDEAGAEATRRWLETAEACLDSGTIEDQWRCIQEREPEWLRWAVAMDEARERLPEFGEGGSLLYGRLSRDASARLRALLHRQDLLVRRMVERYQGQAQTMTHEQRKETLGSLLKYCERIELMGWRTWGGEDTGCQLAAEQAIELFREQQDDLAEFADASLVGYWVPAVQPETAEEAKRLYDRIVKAKDWAGENPDHPLSLRTLLRVAQQAADNSRRQIQGGPSQEEWLGIVLDAANLAQQRVLQPLECAKLGREALGNPGTRRSLLAALEEALRVRDTLRNLEVAGVSGGAIDAGLANFRDCLDEEVDALVEAVRGGDRETTVWFRALSDVHEKLAAAGVGGRSPAQAVGDAMRSAAQTTGPAPGCLTCHSGGGGLSRQQARELLRLLRFAARTGRPVGEVISPDEARDLLEHLWQALLQDLAGAPEDEEIQSLVEEFAQVVEQLRSAGMEVPEAFGTGELTARQAALSRVLLNRINDLTQHNTLANLVAVLRAARAYHRTMGFLAWQDPDFQNAASNFDLMAGRVAVSVDDPSLPGQATPRELGWALDVVAELAPANPQARAVLAPGHEVDGQSFDAFIGLALDMLSESDRMNRRGEPGRGERGWVLLEHDVLLGRIAREPRKRFLARAADLLAGRLGDDPDYDTVREAVALADLAERLEAPDVAERLRRAAASGVGALVREPASGAEELDRRFALAGEAGSLSQSRQWQRFLAEELAGEAPHASPADLVAMALLRVRQALGGTGPSRPRGLELVAEAVLKVPPEGVVNAQRHELGLAAAGNVAQALTEEWGDRAGEPVREAVRGALQVLADPVGAARTHLPGLVAQAASSASYAFTGKRLEEPERERVRAAVRAFLRGDLRGEPMTPAEAARALGEILEALGEPDTPAARAAQKAAQAALVVAAVLYEQASQPETAALVAELARLLGDALEELRNRAGVPEEAGRVMGWLARWSDELAVALGQAMASSQPDAPAWAVILAGLGATVFEEGTLEGDLYRWAVAQAPALVETASGAGQGAGAEAALPLLEQLARAEGAPELTCILNRHAGGDVPPGLSLLPLAAGIELARAPDLLESQETLPQAGLNVAAGLFNVIFSGALTASCPEPEGLPEDDTAVGAFVRGLGNVQEMQSDLEFAAQMLVNAVRAAEELAGQEPDLANALEVVWEGPETVDYGNGPVRAGNTGLKHLIRGDADLLEVGMTAPRTAKAVFDAVVRKVEALNDPFLSRLLDLLAGACPPGTPAGPGGLLVLAPDRCWDGLTNVILAVLEELRIGAVFAAEVAAGERQDFQESRSNHIENAANPEWEWGWLQTAPFEEAEGGWLVFDREKMERTDWISVPKGYFRQIVAGIDVARWVTGRLAALAESVPEFENPGETVLTQSPLGDRSLGGTGFSGVAGGWVGALRPDGSLDNYLSLVGNLEFPVLGATAAQILYKADTFWPDSPFEPSDTYLTIRMGSGVPETETLSRYFGDTGEWWVNAGAQVFRHASRVDAKLGPQDNEFLLTSLTKYFGFELGKFVLRGRVNLNEDSGEYLNGELCSALTAGVPFFPPGAGLLPFPGGVNIGGEGRLWRWGSNMGFGLAVNAQVVPIAVEWPVRIEMNIGATLGAALSSRSGGMCARPYVEGTFGDLTVRNDMLAGVQVYNGPGGPGIKARYLVDAPVVQNTFWVYFAPREVYIGVLTPSPGQEEPPPYPLPGDPATKLWFREDGTIGGVEVAEVGEWGGWAEEDPFGELCRQDLTCGIQME